MKENIQYLKYFMIVIHLFLFQQLMHAIAMVHKMQRLALSTSNSMDIEEKKCSTITEDEEVGGVGVVEAAGAV